MVKTKELQKYTVHLLAECFATCILILIGEAGIANYKFARQPSHSKFPIAVAFGIGVYAALMIAGPVTGGHINPAVSIALMTVQQIKPLQCIFYVIGQILGAFLGAFFVYLVYSNQFNEFDGGRRQMIGPNGTADIFFTMPGKGIQKWNAFIDQIMITAILLIYIMALSYKLNKMISEIVKPFAYALLVIAISSAFSINAGAAMNPARDLGPRIFGAFIYGWNNVFSINNYFFYIQIIGPIIGGIIGVWIYQGYCWIIENYGHVSKSKDEDTNAEKNDRNGIKIKNQESLELQQKLVEVTS